MTTFRSAAARSRARLAAYSKRGQYALIAGAVLAVGATGASAATLITGSDVADSSLTGRDIKNGSITLSDLSDKSTAALAGKTGATGPRGADGLAGANGQNGVPGAKGDAGTAGAKGDAGTPGAQGGRGDQGLAGVTGATGAEGSTGATGAQGTTGPQGTTGTAGTNGVTGANGVTGPQGNTGPRGVTGEGGATGASGATGSRGATGEGGSTGPTGATGVAGTSGGATTVLDATVATEQQTPVGGSLALPTVISFAGEFVDPDGAWDGTTFTAPASGLYRVEVQTVGKEVGAYLTLDVNGLSSPRSVTGGQPITVSNNVPPAVRGRSTLQGTIELAANETFQISAYSASTVVGTTTDDGDASRIKVFRVG